MPKFEQCGMANEKNCSRYNIIVYSALGGALELILDKEQ